MSDAPSTHGHSIDDLHASNVATHCDPPKSMPFYFTGAGWEFFAIWIVNVFLSIITLGIYSPWAKVRSLRYFYQNTRLEGSTFDYHGDPIAILKGRLLIFGVWLVSGIALEFEKFVLVGGILIGALVLIMPLLLVKSIKFRMAYSSYRGIRFGFSGDKGEAYKVFMLWPALVYLSLSVLAPFAHHRLKRFIQGNAHYGATPFSFSATPGNFYWVYFKVFGILVLLLISFVLLGFSVKSVFFHDRVFPDSPKNLIVGMAVEDGESDRSVVYNLGKVKPMTKVRTKDREASSDDDSAGENPFKKFSEDGYPMGLFVGLFFAYVLMIVVFRSLFSTMIQNLVWNKTSLGSNQFQSRIKISRMFWIYLTNAFGIVLTFGLFTPFAKVRAVKYRIECLSLTAASPIDEFVAAERQQVAGYGDAFADWYDIDISL